ncbi:MAG: sugar transferase [Deltaproteobacteria bacterium]|nr:sugar transferase [Deltaproteobacteria bacterium]
MELVLIYSDTSSFEPLQSIYPVSLISIMGKPLIQHQLEVFYGEGIRNCTVIASDNLAQIRRFCDDGSRFGMQLKLVTAAPSGNEVESLLRHRNLLGDHCLVLAGRTLANFSVNDIRAQHDASGKRMSVIRHAATHEFVGLITSPPSPGDLFEDCTGSLKDAAESIAEINEHEVNLIDADFPHFVCRSLSEVLPLTATVLDNPSDYIHDTHFAQQDKGVHLGHHTMIHPSAKLHPPVAVGDFCQILEGAEVGPYSTISSGSIIAKGANVKNAIVSPYSYVGEMMEVKDAIVVGANLVQPHSRTKVLVSDPLLLDNVDVHSLMHLGNAFLQKGAAIWLMAALFPMGFFAAVLSKLKKNQAIATIPTIGHGDVKADSDVERLPRFNRYEIADSQLPFYWYPTLLNVLKGEMRFTGPGPVRSDNMGKTSTLLKSVRHTVPPGVFPVDKLFEVDSYEREFAEMIYTNKQGLLRDLRCVTANLAIRFIGQRNAKRLAGL